MPRRKPQKIQLGEIPVRPETITSKIYSSQQVALNGIASETQCYPAVPRPRGWEGARMQMYRQARVEVGMITCKRKPDPLTGGNSIPIL